MKISWAKIMIIAIMVIAIPSQLYAATAISKSPKIIIDGKEVVFVSKPTIVNSKVMAPAETICGKLKINYSYSNGMMVLTKDKRVVKIKLNNSKIEVDGKSQSISIPARTVSNKPYVPVADVCSLFFGSLDSFDGSILKVSSYEMLLATNRATNDRTILVKYNLPYKANKASIAVSMNSYQKYTEYYVAPVNNLINSKVVLPFGPGTYTVEISLPSKSNPNMFDLVQTYNVVNYDSNNLEYGDRVSTDSTIVLNAHIQNSNNPVQVSVTKAGETHKVQVEPRNGRINGIIYLTFGKGSYEIEVVQDNGDETFRTLFNVENIDSIERRYLFSSSLIQSNSQKIVILAKEITKGVITEADKSKAIHDWVASNVKYDINAYLNGDGSEAVSSLDVLNRKAALCSGYSYLTAALHRAVGIQAKVVLGVALKSDNESLGDGSASSINHAWNEVYVDGKWTAMDTTWDAGFVDYSNKTFTFSLRYKYYNPDVGEFSRDHLKVTDFNEYSY